MDAATDRVNGIESHAVARRHGKLHMVTGPMGSEKSTELARHVQRCRRALRNSGAADYAAVILVPMTKMRFGAERVGLETRNGLFMDAFAITLDVPLCESVKRADVASALAECSSIFVDEGQFFAGVAEFCEHFLALGKNIVVAALELTSERSPFGEVPLLVAQAEKHTRLSAVCTFCGARAIFTVCLVAKEGDVLVGGDADYRAACRTCWSLHHSDAVLPNGAAKSNGAP